MSSKAYQSYFSGFNLYGQAVLGQTPCITNLLQTVSIPSAIAAAISSLSALVTATATSPNTTVSVRVVNNQIFALSLPLIRSQKPAGLSTGAKIGIGLGAGFGLFFALVLGIWLVRLKRHRAPDTTILATQTESQIRPMYSNDYRKSMTSSTVTPVNASFYPNSPHDRYSIPRQQDGWQQQAPQQQQQTYSRMPPKRYGENQVAMPLPGSVSPQSYSPQEMPSDRDPYELHGGTPT
jgi:hypothetical protein